MIRVAVADDNQIIRSTLRLFFSEEPEFQWAGEAKDGEEAIQLVMTQDVDVLVLDLCMPGLGGLGALPRLRAAAPHLRVVVLSGYPLVEYERKAAEVGVSASLEKPAGIDAIVGAIQRAML